MTYHKAHYSFEVPTFISSEESVTFRRDEDSYAVTVDAVIDGNHYSVEFALAVFVRELGLNEAFLHELMDYQKNCPHYVARRRLEVELEQTRLELEQARRGTLPLVEPSGTRPAYLT